jgi:hypothetical protein
MTKDLAADGGFLARLGGADGGFLLPGGVVADLDAALSLGHGIALDAISGTAGSSHLDGSLHLPADPAAPVTGAVTLSGLDLDAAAAALAPLTAVPVPAMAAAMTRDADMAFTLDSLTSAGKPAGHARAHLRLRAATLFADDIAGTVLGVDFAGHGALARDGAIHNLRLDAASADGSRLAAILPPKRRLNPALWHGPVSLALTVDGPAEAIASQVRLDLGDLRLESETRLSRLNHSLAATLTARHPGVPRLLAQLGLSGAEYWLGTGSLALRAHLTMSEAGQVVLTDTDLTAASLIGGGNLLWDGAILSGELNFANLPLPDGAALAAFSASPVPLSLKIKAAQITRHFVPLATNASAGVWAGFGALTLSPVAADIAQGRAVGEFAGDFSSPVPQFALRGALTGMALPATAETGWPLDIYGGTGNLSADVYAHGASLPAILASLTGDIYGGAEAATLSSIDLAHLSRLHGTKPARRAVTQVLSAGTTQGAAVKAMLRFNNGVAELTDGQINAAGLTVPLTGGVDFAAQNLTITLDTRAVAGGLAVRLSGPWAHPRRVVTARLPPAGGLRPAPAGVRGPRPH